MLLHQHAYSQTGRPCTPRPPWDCLVVGTMGNTEALSWLGLLELGTLSRSLAPIGSGIRRGIGGQESIILPGPEVPGKLNLILT